MALVLSNGIPMPTECPTRIVHNPLTGAVGQIPETPEHPPCDCVWDMRCADPTWADRVGSYHMAPCVHYYIVQEVMEPLDGERVSTQNFDDDRYNIFLLDNATQPGRQEITFRLSDLLDGFTAGLGYLEAHVALYRFKNLIDTLRMRQYNAALHWYRAEGRDESTLQLHEFTYVPASLRRNGKALEG